MAKQKSTKTLFGLSYLPNSKPLPKGWANEIKPPYQQLNGSLLLYIICFVLFLE
jgi:hypothetical protein